MAPDAKVIRAYSPRAENDYLYFIELGECVVSVHDKSKIRNKNQPLRRLLVGEIFGEIVFLYKARRSATVTSSNYCTLGKIAGNDFDEILNNYPFFKEELLQRTCMYEDAIKFFLQCSLK